MKKSLAMVLLMGVLLSCSVVAGMDATSVRAGLDFEGNEAICYAYAEGNSSSDYITLTMTLYQGSSYISSWSSSGYDYVELDGYATVDMGDYYTLEVEATINGRTYTDSVGAMCE